MKLPRGTFGGLLAVTLVFAALPRSPSAAPRPDLWAKWQNSDQGSATTVEHGAWDRILGTYTISDHPSGINRFRYGEVTAQDREALEDYIDHLQGLEPTKFSKAEQGAYWINLYNAVTVGLILEHYPVTSIREIDISPGFFADGPWDAKLLEIEGEKVSLNDIEHRILRPIWRDSRLHYAVNCASVGCPDLQPTAFTAENMEELLDRGARSYVNHSRGASFDGGRLKVSSIYSWFEEDFGGSDEGVVTHLATFAEEPLKSKLKDYKGRIADSYDWDLNTP